MEITKCDSEKCSIKDRCYRNTSVSDRWQSFSDFSVVCNKDNGYKYLIKNDKYENYDENSLEWCVYYRNIVTQKIDSWNIFEHQMFFTDVKQLLHDQIPKDNFAERLRILLYYYFGSKCEYEVIISPWIGQADSKKVDIYKQVMINFQKFVDYVWNYKKGCKKTMTKEKIYKSFYEIVEESAEWGIDEDASKYNYYINGLVDLAHELLKEFDEESSDDCSK